jgi:hypothetical protein
MLRLQRVSVHRLGVADRGGSGMGARRARHRMGGQLSPEAEAVVQRVPQRFTPAQAAGRPQA